MANFFAELKRRHIYRVAAAYAVVAWVLLQLVNNVAPILDLPVWVARAFLLLLVIGFPAALFFAWMRELAPADGGTARATTGRLDWALIGALVVVIALVSYQQLAPSRGASTAQQASAVAAPVQPAGISIAVLPFTNLSGDTNQEFFSDGMTEEIGSALAKVPTLRMVGRTSAFQFKGQNKDLRAIGQSLGATYLIEGSVRKAGERVRVTVQLVKADDGIGLWTDNYDRDLKDIFATQEDIAQAIAGALRVPLGLKQGASLVSSRTNNAESYDQYLRAKAMVRARGPKPLDDAAVLLGQVVAREPNYAPAWALLAQAYAVAPIYSAASFSGNSEEFRRLIEESLAKADPAAQRAVQLDSNLADSYVSLALVQKQRGQLLAAEDTYKKALALDPNNPDALHWYSVVLGEVGRLKEALAMRQRLLALEPFVPVFSAITATHLWVNGQTDSAIVLFRATPSTPPSEVAMVYASLGRYSEAADMIKGDRIFPPEMAEEAARLLRTAPAATPSPQTLPRIGLLDFVYLYVGAPDRVLESFEGPVVARYMAGGSVFLWHPSYAPVRKTQRFKAFLRNAGIVDYWRARGWPDLCRPVGADDFVCD